MSTSTADIIALIGSRLNAVRDELQARVAEYGEAQGREMDGLQADLALATAAAQDLQRQLDAARKRIAELEGQQPQEPEPGEPVPPAPAEPPAVTATMQGNKVRLTIGPQTVPVSLHIRSKAAKELVKVLSPGETTADFHPTEAIPYQTGWELWAWAQHGTQAGPETRIVVTGPGMPSEPSKPDPLPQPPDIIITDPPYPQPPANAVVATSVERAVKLRDECRRSGQPFVVRGLTIDSAQLPDRQLSLDGCRGPVWILDNEWIGDSRGFQAHESPLFWDNEKAIYIAGNTFRDMPRTCAIFAYGPTDCVIEGNRFENVHQPIHLILRESADAKLTIAGNVGRGISRIAIEIQSSNFGRGAGQRIYETRGVRLLGNDMTCTVGGEMVYSLACPSARDMLVKGNRAWLPVKGSAQDANPAHGGLGYGFEIMAGRYEDNTVIGATHAGYVLEGDMAPWGAFIAASNAYAGPGKRIGYQNGGDRNAAHVVE